MSQTGLCVGDPKGSVSIALYGDSHIGQWIPALNREGKIHHWKLRVFAKSGCPSVHVPADEACIASRATTESDLRNDPPTW